MCLCYQMNNRSPKGLEAGRRKKQYLPELLLEIRGLLLRAVLRLELRRKVNHCKTRERESTELGLCYHHYELCAVLTSK